MTMTWAGTTKRFYRGVEGEGLRRGGGSTEGEGATEWTWEGVVGEEGVSEPETVSWGIDMTEAHSSAGRLSRLRRGRGSDEAYSGASKLQGGTIEGGCGI